MACNSGSCQTDSESIKKITASEGPCEGTLTEPTCQDQGTSLFARLGVAEGSEQKARVNMVAGASRPLGSGWVQLLLPQA